MQKRLWPTILLLALTISTVASASEPQGSSWLRFGSGWSSSPYWDWSGGFIWIPNPYGGEGTLCSWSGKRDFTRTLVLDGTFERLVHERLGVTASIAHVRSNVESSGYASCGSTPREPTTIDLGTFSLTPVTAGFTIHPFKVRRFDVFLGLEGGKVFTGSMGYNGENGVAEADVDDPWVWGWNLGISMRLGKVRAVGALRSLRGFPDVVAGEGDTAQRIESDGAQGIVELGLAFAL